VDKIQDAQIKQAITRFIASLSSTPTGKEKRKRKLGGEQLDHWDPIESFDHSFFFRSSK